MSGTVPRAVQHAGGRVFVIAEIGSVHDGSLGNALRLVEEAAATGADAVKFQTHIAQAETLRDAPSPAYFTAEPRFAYFERTAFTRPQWEQIRQRCLDCDVEFLSSPFSEQAVELLDELGMRRWKIPSGEVTNLPLLDAVARRGGQVLLSSGMSDWQELDAAVATVRAHHDDLVVLQCTSAYPCPPERVGLNVLAQMRERYGCPVGLSDHSADGTAAVAAVALGARYVEKHITLSRRMYGSDAANSLEPEPFAAMVQAIRDVEVMLASPVDKDDTAPYEEMKRVFQKSVVTTAAVRAGQPLTAQVLACKKPGTGIAAARLPELLGSSAARDLAADVVLQEDDVLWRTA